MSQPGNDEDILIVNEEELKQDVAHRSLLNDSDKMVHSVEAEEVGFGLGDSTDRKIDAFRAAENESFTKTIESSDCRDKTIPGGVNLVDAYGQKVGDNQPDDAFFFGGA